MKRKLKLSLTILISRSILVLKTFFFFFKRKGNNNKVIKGKKHVNEVAKQMKKKTQIKILTNF